MTLSRSLLAVAFCAAGCLALPSSSSAAEKVAQPFSGKSLEGWTFKNPKEKSKWTVGRAKLNAEKPNELTVEPATEGGELVNAQGGGVDIYSLDKWGDCTISLELMVPKGSNSGVYVMGEYEIQVLDSYGKKEIGAGDLGGLYGAAAPKSNASKAPGEWQTMVVEFQAPKFDGEKKTANAVFKNITLNGQVIHENVEMKGPTPSGVTGKEAATGPLMFQGDHGPVAFRNLKVTTK